MPNKQNETATKVAKDQNLKPSKVDINWFNLQKQAQQLRSGESRQKIVGA